MSSRCSYTSVTQTPIHKCACPTFTTTSSNSGRKHHDSTRTTANHGSKKIRAQKRRLLATPQHEVTASSGHSEKLPPQNSTEMNARHIRCASRRSLFPLRVWDYFETAGQENVSSRSKAQEHNFDAVGYGHGLEYFCVTRRTALTQQRPSVLYAVQAPKSCASRCPQY